MQRRRRARRPLSRRPRSRRRRARTTLTVYSRDREFAEPLFERFERTTGITIRARWGDPITLADQIIDDGADSPADVFYAPLSDALGSLSADDLPDSILGFADPAWRGRIAWDPTSRSLQDVITELSQLQGRDAARDWLQGIQATKPAVIAGARAIVDVVAAGKIADVGFGSHTYLYYQQANRAARNVAAKFYPGGEPGGLLNVGGLGIIAGTDNKEAANAFVDFMLSREAEQYYAERTYEIPLLEDVELPRGIPSAKDLIVPGLDVREFEKLDDARRLLTDAGILR